MEIRASEGVPRHDDFVVFQRTADGGSVTQSLHLVQRITKEQHRCGRATVATYPECHCKVVPFFSSSWICDVAVHVHTCRSAVVWVVPLRHTSFAKLKKVISSKACSTKFSCSL